MTLHKLNEPDPEPDPDEELYLVMPTLDEELEQATWRYECNGCGKIVAGTEPLVDWLELTLSPIHVFSSSTPPSGIDPFEKVFSEAQHVCSLACLARLGARLSRFHA